MSDAARIVHLGDRDSGWRVVWTPGAVGGTLCIDAYLEGRFVTVHSRHLQEASCFVDTTLARCAAEEIMRLARRWEVPPTVEANALEAVRAHLEEMVRGNAALTKVDAQEHDGVIEVYMSWVFDGRHRWALRRSYTQDQLKPPDAVPRLLLEQYREMHSADPERFGRWGRR